VTLTPSTCIVLDDGTGVVVGYCIGAAHTVAFAQRWRDEFAPSVDQKRVPRPETSTDDPRMEKDGMRDLRDAVYSAHCSMLLDWPETLEKYLAHLHIDILPGYQRRGFGKKLIHAFFDEVKKCGAEGVHLDMVRHNVSGRAFYDKVGFEVCDQILDGGESGETGVNGIVVTLVKRL
jgi:ribosomal protein S18 acetylase RimI-like enzyme